MIVIFDMEDRNVKYVNFLGVSHGEKIGRRKHP